MVNIKNLFTSILLSIAAISTISADVKMDMVNELCPTLCENGLFNSPKTANAKSVHTGTIIYPTYYQHKMFADGSAYLHVYSDAYVMTGTSGSFTGIQVITDLDGNILAEAPGPSAIETIDGTTYAVYDYGSIMVLHNGALQFAYIF